MSDAKDRTVLAWAKKNGSKYDVWIAGEGGINAANACSSLFLDCASLESVQFGNAFHTDYVTNMSAMFMHCNNLITLDVNSWDTSCVTDMSEMFYMSLELPGNLKTLDVSEWDTSGVTNMESMFVRCEKLTTLDVSGWDTAGVADMSWMFGNCHKLTTLDVSLWDTSGVWDMRGMFSGCYNLTTLDVSGWDTSWVSNMNKMFHHCAMLTCLDISSWDVSHVKSYEDFMDSGKQINGKPWEEFFISQNTTTPHNDASISSSSNDVELKLTKSDITIRAGMLYQLELLNGLSADDVEWSSEHPYIASVTDEGVVTTYQSGTTAIIVRYGDQTVQCIIRVH